MEFVIFIPQILTDIDTDLLTQQCSALVQAFSAAPSIARVLYPGDAAYDQSLSSYYSQQEASLKPRCIVKPDYANDVSVAVKTLVGLGRDACLFAVRSGGHTPTAGSANIQDGVTIDLSDFNGVNVNNAKDTVWASPG